MSDIDKLKLLTAWETEPALTEADLEGLLASAAVVDRQGFEPLSETWTPTYDINAAAAQAWLVKAARAAATVEAGPPGSGLVTSRVFENCRTMARIYKARSAATLAFR